MRHFRFRLRFLVLGVSALVLVLAGCNGDGDDDAATAAADEGPVTLDIETLQAETPQGTVTAQEIENAFVGDVTDELFIGIALMDEGSGFYDDGEVLAYLCDSADVKTWLSGELSGDTTVLESGDIRVEFEMADDGITGTVSVDGADLESFTADPAGEDSGLFFARAAGEDEATAYIGGWIVLSANLQRGWWGAYDEEEEEELQMLR
jgi:hypothetical protein